jgi:hypothetical protein
MLPSNGLLLNYSPGQQQGRTALIAAAEAGWSNIIDELIRLGANRFAVVSVRSLWFARLAVEHSNPCFILLFIFF